MRTGSPPTLRGYDDLLIYLPSPCVIVDRDPVKNIGRAARSVHHACVRGFHARSCPGRYKIVLFFFKNRVLCVFCNHVHAILCRCLGSLIQTTRSHVRHLRLRALSIFANYSFEFVNSSWFLYTLSYYVTLQITREKILSYLPPSPIHYSIYPYINRIKFSINWSRNV